MKNLKNLPTLALIYTAASVIIGPLIFMLGYTFFTGGIGDYCDASYYLPSGAIDPRRDIEFHNAQIFQVVGAGLMLGLGLALIASSFITNRKNITGLNIWPVLAVIFVMLGYVAVILMSGKGGQHC